MTTVVWEILVDEANQHKSKVLRRRLRKILTPSIIEAKEKKAMRLELTARVHNEFLLAFMHERNTREGDRWRRE